MKLYYKESNRFSCSASVFFVVVFLGGGLCVFVMVFTL